MPKREDQYFTATNPVKVLMPVLLAGPCPFYPQSVENVRDAQALIDDHVVDGCLYYAEVPRHAVDGEAAQQVVPQVVGILPSDLLEGDVLDLLPTVNRGRVFSKPRNALLDLPP